MGQLNRAERRALLKKAARRRTQDGEKANGATIREARRQAAEQLKNRPEPEPPKRQSLIDMVTAKDLLWKPGDR